MAGSVTFSVNYLGGFPAIRTLGREARDRLEDLLASRAVTDLTIDFAGVEAMSFSFVDEFLGKFVTSYNFATNDLAVKVAGLNDDNLYAVKVCLERRETQAVALVDDRLELVGFVNAVLTKTFDQAAELGTFKANDIAAALSLTPSNANNRLKKLTLIGALRKAQTPDPTRGGKEFVYETVPVAVADGIPLASA